MSNALVIVTFKDGLKLYSQYQGSSDTFYPALFDTEKEAWSHHRHTDAGWAALMRRVEPKNLEDVSVYNGYGGGGEDTVDAQACRHTKQLRVEHTWLDDY